MTTISSTEDYNAFLREPQAVLLAFFGWSKRGLKSLQVFEEWEHEWHAGHPNSSVAFYCFEHALDPAIGGEYFGDVRGDKGLEGGYGGVAWVCRMDRVGLVRSAARTGKRRLTELTEKHFCPVRDA